MFEVYKLSEVIELLTDYHSNGSYETLKENVTLRDTSDYALMIRTTNFESGDFSSKLKFIDRHAYDHLAKSKVYPNDIIMNKIANAGSVYLMPDLKRPVSLAMNLFLIRVDKEKANPRYVYYYLKQNEAYIKQFANGTTTSTITKEAVRNLEIKLPSRLVQDKIERIITTIINKIELNNQMNETLEAMARAIFKEWFIDFGPVRAKAEARRPFGMNDETAALFPDSFEEFELGEIPRGWRKISLSDVMDFEGGTQPPSEEFKDNLLNGYIRLIQIRDYYTESHLTFIPDTSKLRKTTEFDIMIARYGASVGRICWGLTGAYNVALVKVVPLIVNTREFLWCYLSGPLFQDRLIGLSNRSAQAGFNKGDFASFSLVLPEGPELLEKFETKISNLRHLIFNNKAENSKLIELRNLMLPKLISGELKIGAFHE